MVKRELEKGARYQTIDGPLSERLRRGEIEKNRRKARERERRRKVTKKRSTKSKSN